VLAALALATACTGSGAATQPQGASAPASQADLTTTQAGSPTASTPTAGTSTAPALTPLRKRVRPDVLVISKSPMSIEQLAGLRKVAADGDALPVRIGAVRIGTTHVQTLAVEPASFRAYAPQGTAEATPVWEAVARGEAAVAHETAKRLQLRLGGQLALAGASSRSVRLGALATVGLPEVAMVVSDELGAALGLGAGTGAVLSAGTGDPTKLAEAARRTVGGTARIHLLSQPAQSPVAFLTGSRAAKAFGAFSYRYFPDGTIQPDSQWVAANIVTARVPIVGPVRCHRLMIPQLRGALAEIQRTGLAKHIRPQEYAGCYVPRFIERDPSRPISLHTWGIAVDLNVPTNQMGTHGDMHPGVVAAFERWGFRWGGRWSRPDPMHFELAALLDL
jgi:hypothetical protein